MEARLIKFFSGKRCKVSLKSGFGLTGFVHEVTDDALLFETAQATSVISLDQIGQIREVTEE